MTFKLLSHFMEEIMPLDIHGGPGIIASRMEAAAMTVILPQTIIHSILLGCK
jgi:hypothetical protein